MIIQHSPLWCQWVILETHISINCRTANAFSILFLCIYCQFTNNLRHSPTFLPFHIPLHSQFFHILPVYTFLSLFYYRTICPYYPINWQTGTMPKLSSQRRCINAERLDISSLNVLRWFKSWLMTPSTPWLFAKNLLSKASSHTAMTASDQSKGLDIHKSGR